MIAMAQRSCDVLVVGAGVAGISAAVAAAREGAHTVLIEKKSCPGGIAVSALHRFMCGLYLAEADAPQDTINDGIVREVCGRLHARAPLTVPLRMGAVFVLPYKKEHLLSVVDTLISGEKCLETFYASRAVSAHTEKGIITAVSSAAAEGLQTIVPRAVIDCSGQGIIARLCKARYYSAPSSGRQLAGFSIRLKGIHPADGMLALKVPYYLQQAALKNKLPRHLRFTTFIPGEDTDEGYCKLSMAPEGMQDVNSRARHDALLVHAHLAEMIPAFRGSVIAEMSDEAVNRDGCRVCGEYTLSADDIVHARKFPDGAVKNAWPIEFWDQEKGPCYRFVPPGDYYEIPGRCLKSGDISNLYCAGRCLSASAEAMASARVMGTCIAAGEQAGRAAVKGIGR